ncbi:hypothetical protein V1477_010953 [Vespula maculifrons]|uniref:Uncharacterized protein n=1 Tax=Vespula maculifrons TaxID=7453 RepID=A0ABD2C3I3_VESMC
MGKSSLYPTPPLENEHFAGHPLKISSKLQKTFPHERGKHKIELSNATLRVNWEMWVGRLIDDDRRWKVGVVIVIVGGSGGSGSGGGGGGEGGVESSL